MTRRRLVSRPLALLAAALSACGSHASATSPADTPTPPESPTGPETVLPFHMTCPPTWPRIPLALAPDVEGWRLRLPPNRELDSILLYDGHPSQNGIIRTDGIESHTSTEYVTRIPVGGGDRPVWFACTYDSGTLNLWHIVPPQATRCIVHGQMPPNALPTWEIRCR